MFPREFIVSLPLWLGVAIRECVSMYAYGITMQTHKQNHFAFQLQLYFCMYFLHQIVTLAQQHATFVWYKLCICNSIEDMLIM